MEKCNCEIQQGTWDESIGAYVCDECNKLI